MVRPISDRELAIAHAVADAALRCWQRDRSSGTARIFAEQLGTEAAQLASADLDARNKAGAR